MFGGPSPSSVVASINDRKSGGGGGGGGGQLDPHQPAGMEYVVVEGVDLSLS